VTGSCGLNSGAEQIRIRSELDKRPFIFHNYSMKDRTHPIPRSHMSVDERKARSQLAQLVSQRGLMRGSLLVRRMTCGKPNCRCARGERHESLFVVISEKGRTRQLFVPKDWEPLVRRWVEDHHRARQLMEEVSRIYWDKVRKRRK